MPRPQRAMPSIPRRAVRRRHSSRAVFGAAACAVTVAIISTSLVLAAGGPVLRSSANSTLGATVVTDSHGRTLYALSPETTHHLLCRSRACFGVWPPATVHSRAVKLVAGHGVEGRIGILRRSDGRLQLTLRGLPLYRFSGDSSAGQANGEGIKSFGGTWYAVRAKAHSTATPPSMPSPTPSY
jgi:predicted lipoprotein with Yx(FWY)xxD motif